MDSLGSIKNRLEVKSCFVVLSNILMCLVLFICITCMELRLIKTHKIQNGQNTFEFLAAIALKFLRFWLISYYMSVAMKPLKNKTDPHQALKMLYNSDMFSKGLYGLPPINSTIIAFPMHPDVKKFMEDRGKTLENMLGNEWVRLSTFSSFPKDSPVSTMRLSSAGFYYDATSGDEVICFKCGAKYKGWKSDDVPLLVHQRISPTCPFIQDKVSRLPIGATSQGGAGPLATSGENQSRAGASSGSNDDPSTRLSELKLAEQPTEISNEARNSPVRSFTETRVGNPEPALPVVGSRGESTSAIPTTQPQTSSRANETANFASPTQSSSQQQGNVSTAPSTGLFGSNRSANSENTVQTAPVSAATVTQNLQPLGITTAKPRYPNFAVYMIRLQTFKNWPTHMNQKPEDLAKAGFFYEGKNDNVRCFFCGGGLRDWEEEDEPWIEHARWYQKCIYVRQSKGDDYVRAVVSGQLELLQRQQQQQQQTGPETSGPETPRQTDMMQVPAVISVLEMGYPEGLVKRAYQKCVSQYGGESNVSAEKLMPMVWQLEEEPESGEENEPETTSSGNQQQTTVDPEPSPANELPVASGEDFNRQIEEENRILREQQLCKICMEEDVAIVFLPCGHMVTCVSCAAALRTCPICRTLIRGTVKAILT